MAAAPRPHSLFARCNHRDLRRCNVCSDMGVVGQRPAGAHRVRPAGVRHPPTVWPIDRATTGCDLDGEASVSDPIEAAKQSAQNLMKNEFCAWRDTDPALVTRFSFDQLQKRLPASFPWGSRTNMPTAEERKAIREFYTTSEGGHDRGGVVCRVRGVSGGGPFWWR